MRDKTPDRVISLFGADGSPLNYLSAIVYAFSVFPDDERSRAQVLNIFDLEKAAYHQNKVDFEYSELVKALLVWADNRAGQRYAAGLTMLAFQTLFFEGDGEVTLYRAAQVVEAALGKATEQNARPLNIVQFEKGESKVKGVRVPTGRRDIEKAYRKYESVSHLLAADLLVTNSLKVLPIFERNIHMDAVLINTAAAIERAMLEREPDQFRSPWRVLPSINAHTADLGAVEFEGEFVDFLRAGLEIDG
ncbi:hypothetical protein [Sulfitobacter mediterraneus]|uniref:Uncharacterized protein n=1 Tax=Sulfitobacter mediterraneus TaxID=83219 RepID=A0A061SWN9_9RHOB|nr:hypothetical protein [Sulfitobacter mediterraneus]KAJ04279.1 hypothetical protein PM02_04685 [Sulfitobacter mediterraneus]